MRSRQRRIVALESSGADSSASQTLCRDLGSFDVRLSEQHAVALAE
jgi:hypothetical protein